MNATLAIILLTVLVSVLAMNNEMWFDRLKFNAYDAKHSHHWYRFLTYGFVHAGWVHLFINMFVLYSFGEIVEGMFRIHFLQHAVFYYILLYAGALMLSVIPAFGKHKNDVFYNAVGASGAVSAVVFSSIILFPSGKIFLFFIPIGIPAPIFGILYLAYEYSMSRRGRGNIGHDAHFWGAVYGVGYTILLKPQFAVDFLRQIGLML